MLRGAAYHARPCQDDARFQLQLSRSGRTLCRIGTKENRVDVLLESLFVLVVEGLLGGGGGAVEDLWVDADGTVRAWEPPARKKRRSR